MKTIQQEDQVGYFLWLNEKPEGPFTEEGLYQKWLRKEINPQTLFASSEVQDWQPLGPVLEQIVNRKEPSRSNPFPTFERIFSELAPAPGAQFPFEICGAGLIVGGIILAGFFFLVFDTSVPGSGDLARVTNLERAQIQHNGILCGIAVAILGGIFLIVDRLDKLLDRK